MDKIHIFGSSIAGLVGADSLANNGYPVELWLNGGVPGGIFAGIPFENETFDCGMNLLEFTSFAKGTSDLSRYDMDRPNDAARFTESIRNYVHNLIGPTVEVPLPQMTLNGREYYNDFIIANQFQSLKSLSDTDKKKSIDELKQILETRPRLLKAENKFEDSHFLQKTYAEVAVINHGRTLHDHLILKLHQKIAPSASYDVPARWHRSLWMPLYYSETLLRALQDSTVQQIGSTQFFYLEKGEFSTIVKTLFQKLKGQKNVQIHDEKIEIKTDVPFFTISGHSTVKIDPSKCVFAIDPEKLFTSPQNLAANESKNSRKLSLVLLLIPEKYIQFNFSTIHVCCTDSDFFRITLMRNPTTNGHRKILIESFYFSEPENEISTRMIIDELKNLNIIRSVCNENEIKMKWVTFPFKAPEINQTFSENTPTAFIRIGPAVGFHKQSFNEQILQGLALPLRVRNSSL